MSAAPTPTVVLKRDRGYFRVEVRPSSPLPLDYHRPATNIAHCLASDAARLLGQMTGWPVIDETQKGSGNVLAE